MKTKNRIFFPTSSEKFESVIPVECPHCGAYSTPQIVAQSCLSYSSMKIWLFIFHNDCCDKQSFDAEQNSYFELAGSGYRNAIEVLIKDFAIQELKAPEKEVCKKSLSQAIEAYLPNINASVSADVTRVLGNDYTHYERRYEDVDFHVLKRYLQIFINSIDCEYLISHPVVPTNPNLTQ